MVECRKREKGPVFKIGMKSLRVYGKAPYGLVLLHGGPGARGSLAGAARELGRHRGVWEPLQTRHSIPELLEELHKQLAGASEPLTLAGHSWGAWLGILYASLFPQHVKHLVLISCPPLEDKFVPQILQRRLALLPPAEAAQYKHAQAVLEHHAAGNPQHALETLQSLTQQTDFFCPCNYDDRGLELDEQQYAAVWPQAAHLRSSGKLLAYARQLRCPVSLLHGAQDPHPVQGVLEPLQACGIQPQQIIVWEKCGHSPFAETYAHEDFYRFLQTA